MATRTWSSRAGAARAELFVLKSLAGVTAAILASLGLTGAASAPGDGLQLSAATETRATLARSGDDLLITGSVNSLFALAGFTGPNRALKQDRARPQASVIEVAEGFTVIRARIAELRRQQTEIVPIPNLPPALAAAEAPVEVAALGPAPESAALDAIASVAPGAVPTPKQMSEKLAYARADLPATVPADGTLSDKNGKAVSDKELWCMATAIYFEARGEIYRGQVAVGQVVLNRVAHKLYPDTICGVVFQNQHKRNACQFSFACDGIPEKINDQKSWKQANDIAKGVIAGTLTVAEVGAATHYHATYVYPHWAPRMKKLTKVGLHVFYQFKRGWQFG